MNRTPPFPGGTSVSRLSVYASPCTDGLAGGTPHLHTASTEAYVVIGGEGELQTLDASGFRSTPLAAGTTVWFTPGTIHRAVNHGNLQVVVVMQNAGLPEAGDAVMTFPPEIVADAARYTAAATLPADASAAQVDEAVRRRRDLAVSGFRRLVASAEAGDFAPLERLYASAVALVRPRVAGWRRTWQDTVERETRHTADILDALDRGDGHHLRRSVLLGSPASEAAHWGMCGRLHTHDVHRPAVLSGPTDPEPPTPEGLT
ncbi:cupin domain-containing protein [Micromonospora sp. KC213]|uniref:cupin domain-containing protein n=1 Tax=Micromonospora sp. KC213 TaxID=2530378 RepID=UPI0010464B39|nr:cupin domain-containing protein [Micromonospora sp. KC213]TDC39581.1 cupin domain-containing protein [Micromonospora sp. KC213]